MKKSLLFLLLAASLSFSSLAQTTCIAVADGKHLLAGRIDLAQLEQQTNRWTIYVVNGGSIVPTWVIWWSSPHVGPPPSPFPLGLGLGLVGAGELDVEHLALAHAGDAIDAERFQRPFDGLALRIENARFQCDGNARFHVLPQLLTSTGPEPAGRSFSIRMPSRLATSV